jgi:GTP-binding protein
MRGKILQEDILSSFKKDISFIAGTSNIRWFPNTDLPEFAFFGRSNVGKSSLINYLCNRKDISRVSNTPGRTTEINFFNLDNKLVLVDLPGYGYAKRSIDDREKWLKLIEHYFLTRVNLLLVNILIDSRRGIGSSDLEIIDFLYKIKKEFQIVFTKYDKLINKTDIIEDCKKHLIQYNYTKQFIFTSSRRRYGAEEVQLSLASYLKGY